MSCWARTCARGGRGSPSVCATAPSSAPWCVRCSGAAWEEEPGWERVDDLVEQLAADAALTARRIGAGPGGRRALDVMHMDANRFGVNPAEECVAGVCARYLLGSG